MKPEVLTMSDGCKRLQIIVGASDCGGCGGDNAQRIEAFLTSKGNLLLEAVGHHSAVVIALNFDDVLVANADDICRHEHGIMGFC